MANVAHGAVPYYALPDLMATLPGAAMADSRQNGRSSRDVARWLGAFPIPHPAHQTERADFLELDQTQL